MNTILPEIAIDYGFYIWFNKEKREEYYSTPLYFYKADYKLDYDNRFKYVYWKETEGTDRGLKHPTSIYFPYVEKFGLLLLRFLNADLSSYETAYKDFFYAYGFEILLDLDENYSFKLSGNYGSDENFLKETKNIFNNLQEQLIHIQEELKDAVGEYIYVKVKGNEYYGTLHSFENETLTLKVKDKTREKDVLIEYPQIKKVRYAVKF